MKCSDLNNLQPDQTTKLKGEWGEKIHEKEQGNAWMKGEFMKLMVN